MAEEFRRSSSPFIPSSPSAFTPRPISPVGSSSSSSSVSSLEMDSTSPALATASSVLSLGPATGAVRGLVTTNTRSYAAPGDHSFLAFAHTYGCRNAMDLALDNSVRGFVAQAIPATMKEVEKIAQGVLLGRGCSATCGLDKDSTTGLFVRYNSDRGSLCTPSILLPSSSPPLAPDDSQLVVPESSMVPPMPDGSVELPVGGPSSAPGSPSVSSPDNTPLFGPSSFAAAPVAAGSISTPSGLSTLSSGEKQMYKKRGFRLDRSSDEDYVPPALLRTAPAGLPLSGSLDPCPQPSAIGPPPSARPPMWRFPSRGITRSRLFWRNLILGGLRFPGDPLSPPRLLTPPLC